MPKPVTMPSLASLTARSPAAPVSWRMVSVMPMKPPAAPACPADNWPPLVVLGQSPSCVCVRERTTNRLYNAWIDLHHLNVPANTDIVLALDLWEHAYMLDFAPAQRSTYFDTLWDSIDWSKVESRCR